MVATTLFQMNRPRVWKVHVFFTATNKIIVRLLQIGLIVSGVLACGITRKVLEGVTLPVLTSILFNQGVFLLAITLNWVSVALWLRGRLEVSEGTKLRLFAGSQFGENCGN